MVLCMPVGSRVASVLKGRVSEPVGHHLDLRGLKCPLPAMLAKKALRTVSAGATLVVACTDPLAAVDIPNLVREMGCELVAMRRDGPVLLFRIRVSA